MRTCVSCGRNFDGRSTLCFDCHLLEAEGGTPPMEWLYVKISEEE